MKDYKLSLILYTKVSIFLSYCNRQQVNTNIIMDNRTLENVTNFTYLGSKITNNGKSKTELSQTNSIQERKNC